MKLMMILGGLIGFVVSLGAGLLQEEVSWPALLGRACVAALLSGWLLRWWSHQWLRSLNEANRLRWLKARQEAERLAAAADAQRQTSAPAATPTAATHKP